MVRLVMSWCFMIEARSKQDERSKKGHKIVFSFCRGFHFQNGNPPLSY